MWKFQILQILCRGYVKMNYIGIVLLGLYFIYGFYNQIKQILIGKKVIKSKKYTEDKELNKIFIRGVIFLIFEIIILIFFIRIMLS